MKIFDNESFKLKHCGLYPTLIGVLSMLVVACGATLFWGQPAAALCIAAPEAGLWQNLKGDDPFQVKITQPNCETEQNNTPPFSVTVWVRQFNRALYNRGIFAGQTARSSDGTFWVVTQYSVGGYLNHQWMKKYTFNGVDYLRVWIYEESLDAKPSATENFWFRKVR